MKYIFVTGGVVSSLGKGLTAAALGTLLENRARRQVSALASVSIRTADANCTSSRSSVPPRAVCRHLTNTDAFDRNRGHARLTRALVGIGALPKRNESRDEDGGAARKRPRRCDCDGGDSRQRLQPDRPDCVSWGGFAATAQVVVIEDVRTDARAAAGLELFESFGLRSMWSYPMRSVTGRDHGKNAWP